LDFGFAIVGLVQQLVRVLFAVLEITILSALVLATRCANYRDVFVDGNIYFSDADCYSRMTRVRICAEHPGGSCVITISRIFRKEQDRTQLRRSII
jgi:hypothetical protein